MVAEFACPHPISNGMENNNFNKNESPAKKLFSSPEEELDFLRKEVRKREIGAEIKGEDGIKNFAVKEILKTYAEKPVSEILSPDYALSESNKESIVLDLSPEAHDKTIEELIGILEKKGIKNTISILQKMGRFHIEDDFHRFLVQYVKAGFKVQGLKEKTSLGKSLHATLYEITLPEVEKEEGEKELKKLISGMEQFYAGLLSISSKEEGENSFSIEVANPEGSEEFIFYGSVPDNKKVLFEKQILSIFPSAKIKEIKNDYNIFNESGVSVASVAYSARKAVFPLKTYEEFDVDPLNILLNSFSKIKKSGQGAAVQFIFKPAPSMYLHKYQEAMREIQKGKSVREATDIKFGLFGELASGIKDFLSNKEEKEKKKREFDKEPLKVDEVTAEQVKKKVDSPLFLVGIRLVASAETAEGAIAILSDLEAVFNQFENTHGNKLAFKRFLKGASLARELYDFSFRIFESSDAIPLNLKEMTTMMHFPSSRIVSSPELKQAKAGDSAAPVDLPSDGILLGVNKSRSVSKNIYMAREDRLRHFYVVGQTGTGKTTLLKNMIVQDIQNGEGVCMIDPHGADIQDIMASIPPERYEDVIYFDPSYTARPMALNMLEYDTRFPEQKTFVVNEMLSIFNKLFDMKTAGGPMFEQYFRNSVLLTIEDPETGNTLLDVSRVLANRTFREMKLSRCKNPIVIQFWKKKKKKAGGETALANIVPYVTSKFDNFLANDIMRPIISQEKSSFNFREIMDSKKILLVNLSKGRLGDLNANLIGLILVGKILMAALSRVDSYLPAVALAKEGGMTLPAFYLYIDEFQNITTDSIATILSEARKYKLALIVAHQFIAQLEEKIKDAVFGNVGSLASFRVGSEDAEFLEKQFSPVFTERDIVNLDNHHAYLKLLVLGRPVRPFNIETLPPPSGNRENIPKLQELSYLKFGREREEVEGEIMKKYQK